MASGSKAYAWTTHEEAARQEGAYWRSVSIEERVSAVETIRQATIGIYELASGITTGFWHSPARRSLTRTLRSE